MVGQISCTTMTLKNTDFKTLVTDSALGQFNDLEFGKWRSSNLNLQQIYKGVDSFELRIWNFGMWSPKEVVVLRYFNNMWTTCNYVYQENGFGMADSIQIRCKRTNPEIAAKIQRAFTQDSLLTLPSQTAIPNFKDNTADGDTYFIEIATKKFYKTLGYHNPQKFNDPYNRQFVRLIQFLELYFDFFHTN
jgi:hypothetical protein